MANNSQLFMERPKANAFSYTNNMDERHGNYGTNYMEANNSVVWGTGTHCHQVGGCGVVTRDANATGVQTNDKHSHPRMHPVQPVNQNKGIVKVSARSERYNTNSNKHL